MLLRDQCLFRGDKG